MGDRQGSMYCYVICVLQEQTLNCDGCWAGLCTTELLAGNTLHCNEGKDFAHLLDQSSLKEYSCIFSTYSLFTLSVAHVQFPWTRCFPVLRKERKTC